MLINFKQNTIIYTFKIINLQSITELVEGENACSPRVPTYNIPIICISIHTYIIIYRLLTNG